MCESTSNDPTTSTKRMPMNSQMTEPTTTAAAAAALTLPTKEVLLVDPTLREEPMKPPMTARYSCAGIMVAIFAVWGQYTFSAVPDETKPPTGPDGSLHTWRVPAAFCLSYLVSLPTLKYLCQRYLWQTVDVRALLTEAMIVYNAGQVLLNGWMVYRIIYALVYGDHPFIQGTGDLVSTGTTFAVWVHYTDKYLEFMDTYFMVFRGKMDQVSFLHVYHHVSISLAWWFALWSSPGGDNYFGALVNSWIHVMMYSYYTLALLKIPCPWKRYLTQAQLLQFVSVVGFTIVSYSMQPAGTWFLPYFVQLFEMISLLVLFLHFYRMAYRNKKAESQRANVNAAQSAAKSNGSSSSSSTKKIATEDENPSSGDEPDTVSSSSSSEGVSSDVGDD